MDKAFFNSEVEAALEVLRRGGVILYPTDTIWGLGCDATHEAAVKRIYSIKKREDSKSMIVLVADERDLLRYVASPDPAVFDFLEAQSRPTTVIFDGALGLPEGLLAQDGSIALRIVKDEFCRHLLRRLRVPIVSTSANISGEPSPAFFSDVTSEIREAVDYVVRWRQEDREPSTPSQIIRWKGNGTYTVIRS